MLGAKEALLGFKAILHPKVRHFTLIPLLINFLVFAGLFYYFADIGFNKLSFLSGEYLPAWLSWLGGMLKYIRYFLIMIYLSILLTVFAVLATLCANILGAPFNGLLSEAYSKVLGHTPPTQPFWQMVIQTLKRELLKLLYYLPRGIFILILAVIFYFIPGLNITIPLLFLWFSSWMLAVQYIDYPADNHHVSFSALKKIMKQNRVLLLGFGLMFTLLSTIPVINLFVMPSAVLGATKLWHSHLNTL